MANRQTVGNICTMVEFLLGLSATLNVVFTTMWIIGHRANKKHEQELQRQIEQNFGRQLTQYFENWMYKA